MAEGNGGKVVSNSAREIISVMHTRVETRVS